MVVTIASIECTITGNRITQVQSIDSSGQVMALAMGAGLLLSLLWQWTTAWYRGASVSLVFVLTPTLSYHMH